MRDDVVVFLLSLAALLGTARVLGALARRFGLPSVVGEITAGILLGKTVLGRVSPGAFDALFVGPSSTLLEGYTTVAVILLLVVAGTEVDLTIVARRARASILASALGVALPFAAGYALGLFLSEGSGLDPNQRGLMAAFVGIALSISALPLVARTLLDLGLSKTDLGLIVLSAAMLGDIVGWMGFSVLARQLKVDGPNELGSIALTIGLTALFVLATLLIIRPLVDRVLARMASSQDTSSAGLLSFVMVLSLLGAAATEALGMHAALGGFVVGVAVGDSARLREHTRAVLEEIVTSLFTPVFFATIALSLDLVANFDVGLVVIVFVVATVTKVSGSALGARLGGLGTREALVVGFGLNSRGAMEILLARLALQAHLIDERWFVALVIMALATSLTSGPAMSFLLRPEPSPVLSLLRSGVVLLDVPATDRGELIHTLTGTLILRRGYSENVDRVAESVLLREEEAGTGVGDGVAIPHAAIAGFTEPALGFARAQTGLDFNAPDGQPVRLVFLLLNAEGAFELQLQILAAIARLLSQENVRRGLLQAQDEDAVLAILEEADIALAPLPPAARPRRSLS